MENKEVPRGVKITSVFFYFVGIFIVGVWGYSIYDGLLTGDEFVILGIIASIIVIPIGVLFIIIGHGLKSGKNWARMLTIFLGFFGVISLLFQGGLQNLLNVYFIPFILVGAYLLFSKKTKEFFRAQ